MSIANVRYSIVVPVYRSAAMLKELCSRIIAVMEKHGGIFEIILVDDCSPDRSWQTISEITSEDGRISGIQLMRNCGQGGATLCGLSAARGDFLITMDDDLQHPPEELPKMIAALEDNPERDVVMGVPLDAYRQPRWRQLGSYVLSRVNTVIFAKDHKLRLSSFRIMRRNVVEQLLASRTPFPAPGPMLCAITPRISNIEVAHHQRAAGRSGYTMLKIFTLTLSRILSFSSLPLRLLATIGGVGIVLSVILTAFYLLRYLLMGSAVAGFTTLALMLTAVSGFIFFAFGIVGEYLLRILQSVEGTPSFIVRQRVGHERVKDNDKL